MNRETSLYLDFVRLLAALIVMTGHLSGHRFTGGLFWQVGRFMDDAVIVFFVLSGFVIAHVISRASNAVGEYAVARAARMYSVVVPAMVVTFVLDRAGTALAPGLYDRSWGYGGSSWEAYLAGLLFLNQIWHAQIAIGSMLPYWSLGFEAWYYIFIGILCFAPGKWKLLLLAPAMLVAGPRIATLFPVWLMGYGAYWLVQSRPARVGVGAACLAGSVAGYLVYINAIKPWMASHDVAGHGLWVGNIPARYLMGMIFSIHLVGICWTSGLVAGRLRYADKFIRWAAGATFTIYLLHLPVAQFLAALVPWPPADWKTRSLLLVGTPVILVALAEFTERRKGLWIRLFNGIRKLGRNQLHRDHPADAGHTLSQSRSISRTCQ